jgi:hypothetical protein
VDTFGHFTRYNIGGYNMKATRLDIVFDTCVDQEEEYEIINKKIHALFGDDAITDWRDEKTVEITIFRHDVGISTPRPWILEEYK